MTKAVGYCRFSSNNQREESIDAQKRAIKYYAQENGYQIVKFYEDKAQSGKTDQRPSFQQMITDVKNNEFSAVIVHKLDRFSRDIADSMMYEKQLKQHGIELISVMERLDNSPTGSLMKIIISGINKFYVDNLAIEVFKGLKENAYKCQTTGGKPPLGYDIVDKKYVINQYESEAIRIIFSMYDQGYGYGQITQKLNSLGYKTKAGRTFGKNSLYEILHNERYKGVFVYNKHTSRRPDGSRTRSYKSDDDIIRIPGGVPAIVDESMWTRVNERIKQNRLRSGSYNAKEIYLLSGLIYCGECGHVMTGNSRYPSPNRPKLITYRCSHRHMNHNCSIREIKRDDVENFVLEQLQSHLFNDEVIPKLTTQLNSYIVQSSNACGDDEKQLQKRLKELSENQSNVIDAIATTGCHDSLANKLKQIESEIASINSIQKKQELMKDAPVISEDMVREYLGSFKEHLLAQDKVAIKRLIHSYVDRVDVYHKKVSVTLKVLLNNDSAHAIKYSFESETSRKALKLA